MNFQIELGSSLSDWLAHPTGITLKHLLYFSKRVQIHQEVITAHVVKRDINSMNELVNVKILTNVDLVPMTVPVISDAKILMEGFYANLKRLLLQQLPGL